MEGEQTESELDILNEELKMIQKVIHLTRQNIDDLNRKFASFEHPPSMYLTEYEELRMKLHNFEENESDLLQQIDQLNNETAKKVPKSMYFLRAYLPNQQITSVQVSLNSPLFHYNQKSTIRNVEIKLF